MGKRSDVKRVMLEHSRAKVELYSSYLEKYLAVLSNTPFVDRVNIFDLFCGEGLYEDGHEGSPLVGLKKAQKILTGSPRYSIRVHFFFNDSGKSEVEPNITKIERLKRICSQEEYHRNISISYSDIDFADALPSALKLARESDKTKSLFFIDPYGYKEIHPSVVKRILENPSAELILFLPMSHMYRFGSHSFKSPGPSYEALYNFLKELHGNYPDCDSLDSFIEGTKKRFREYLLPNALYVDTYTLQRDKSNTYCLFLFTPNPRGYEKMLEAKWQLDEDHGKGFRVGKQRSLFSGVTFSDYPKKLETYLKEERWVTNQDLYYFGLDNGYLPKHTAESLKHLEKFGTPITVSPLDDLPVKGYYISYENASDNPARKVQISIDKI